MEFITLVNIQNYEILKSIGRGGMGEVFLAHDTICGRNVALKQIREEWAKKKVIQERFLREAKIAAQLSHPSIIPIYSIGDEFYTMPYIEGETLKEILQTTRQQAKKGDPLHPIGCSIPALIQIFLNVCGAVGYAHERGVLHRDLKPDNIIVGTFKELI
nr:Serine/threonine-protein kinase PknD [Chlamydiota bacterium]